MIKNFIKKKGYLFILDSIVALFVLTIGITLILSYRFPEPVTQQLEIYSNDLVQFFTKIRIEDLNDKYFGLNGELVEQKFITQVDNSIIEQIAEFYFRSFNAPETCPSHDSIGCLDLINKSLKSATNSLLLGQFNYEIVVDDLVNPAKQLYLNDEILTKDKAKLILVSKRFIYGVYGNTAYGPYIMEITVWQ